MKDDTKLVAAGRHPEANHGVVNPPVYHASTILYPSVASMRELHAARAQDVRGVYYGRMGTPTTHALEDAVLAVEGGHRCVLYPSGLGAISGAMLSILKTGDHLLMVDTVYAPTRRLCDNTLARYGVETTYYDPLIGAGIADLIRPNTAVVYVEAPGSITFEMQDIPAIAEAAHAKGALVVMDNTWASPLYYKPFEHGVDMSIQAGTKYIVGHSDVMLGTVTANETAWPRLREGNQDLGYSVGPDDIYLALRGMRTLSVRLERHQTNALEMAKWFQARPEVDRVLYPALEDDPGHEIWKRDFLGASGLFGVVLKPCSEQAVAAMIDDLELFGMGFSWGGYESLVVPQKPIRTATSWSEEGPLLRFHIGLEDTADLKADLEAGFARLKKAG
jgi:cystathionine beta-lyase